MTNPVSNNTIVYNGEIYNFLDLRKQLSMLGHKFESATDTEVVLRCYDQWGISFVKELNGMFAFGIFDPSIMKLFLVRDRVGIKPLYYYSAKSFFAFSSELSSLLALGLCQPTLDPDAVASFLDIGYFARENTPLKGFHKILPGYVIEHDICRSTTTSYRYWDLLEIVNQPVSTKADDDLVDELECLLLDSTRRQMISDVPVGAFLSGGIDSTLIAAMMSRISTNRLSTFTIGFSERSMNEAPYAKKIAQFIGSDHHEEYVSSKKLPTEIVRTLNMFDEPFGDTSILPTLILSEMARHSVTVSLSGDGGDELFYGYTRYRKFKQSHLVQSLPRMLQTILLFLLNRAPNGRYRRWAKILAAPDPAAAYSLIVSWDSLYNLTPWSEYPSALTSTAVEANHRSAGVISWWDFPPLIDFLTYLPDDILTKVDRATMNVSLEARVPFLDNRVVEFAWCLPHRLKYCNGVGKFILKQLLSRYVPKALWNRPKSGFGIPLGKWLLGPLKEWMLDELMSNLSWTYGIIDKGALNMVICDHVQQRRDNSSLIWSCLSLKQWMKRYNVSA